jgi:ABC-type transporter Mla subunit MlaD
MSDDDGEDGEGLGVTLEWPDDVAPSDDPVEDWVETPIEHGWMEGDDEGAGPEGDGGALVATSGLRIDTLQSATAGLSTRIDALLASTTSYRSLITDRISDYSEQVTRMARTQASDLEEYRHATDRVIAELRRSVLDSEEALHRIGTRVDELTSDMANVAELARTSIVEGREVSASADKITRSVRDGLDGFTTRVLERLDQVRSGIEVELASVRSDNGRLRQSVADAAAGWNAERAEAAIETIRDDLAGMRDLVRTAIVEEMPAAFTEAAAAPVAAPVADMEPLIEELTAVRSEVASLRRRIAVRAGGDSVALGDEQMSALADAVAARLAETFEIVDEAPQKTPGKRR